MMLFKSVIFDLLPIIIGILVVIMVFESAGVNVRRISS